MKAIFFNILNKLRQSDFIKISLKNSYQVILRFVVGILNIKIISLWIGSSGLVLTGQFMNFLQLAGTLSGISLSQGVTKLVSQYSNTKKRKYLIISNALIFTLLSSAITSIGTYIFSNKLSLIIFQDETFHIYFKLASIVIFSTSLNQIILSIINGTKQYSKYIKINILMIISNLIISIPLIYFGGIDGALTAQYVSGISGFLIIIILSYKQLTRPLKPIRISKYINYRLLRFAIMLMVASTITPIISIIIRNLIINEYGIIQAGWWEGLTRVSRTFYGLCISTLGLFYLPQVSKIQSPKELNNSIKDTLFQALPFISIGILTIYFSRQYIISLLFTDEFSGMQNLFIYQNIGDFFRIINWFYAITFILKEKVSVFIISEIIMSITYILLVYYIIPYFGERYLTLPYMINTIVYFAICQTIYRKYIL